jgi:hypothetical protein
VGGSSRPPPRNFESKEQMMANIRENSQQDRRVYVGNLSYDVKWHHLKDFMRQGQVSSPTVVLRAHAADCLQPVRSCTQMFCFFQMECQRWAEIVAGSAGFFFLFGCLEWLG